MSHSEPAHSFDQVVDPDVDLHDASQRAETQPHRWDLLLTIAAGGVLGSLARYGLSVAMPHSATGFPWATLVINISGSLLIGALMVVLLELIAPHRLARPFLGVGVLGGFTTYSTFAVDVQTLLVHHRFAIVLGYAVLTLAGGAIAVLLGTRTAVALGARLAGQ